MIFRALIIGKIKPGCEEKVAAIFAESDATELPGLAKVRHRSLFALDDLYVHLIETEGDALSESMPTLREHPLFKAISEKLAPYIQPYNPLVWRSPKDAMAREFYTWDAAEK
jgi:cyclase